MVLHDFELYAASGTAESHKIRRTRMQVATSTAEEYVLESYQSYKRAGWDQSSVALSAAYTTQSLPIMTISRGSYGLAMSIFWHQPLANIAD